MPKPGAGVERVLERAAQDAAFREALVAANGAARAELVRGAAIELKPSEAAVLAAVPPDELRRMVQGVVAIRDRRQALVRLALGTAAVGTAGVCGVFLAWPYHIKMTQGIRPDLPPGRFTGWLFTDNLVGPLSSEEILRGLRSAATELASATWVVGPAPVGPTYPPRYLEFRVAVEADGHVSEAARTNSADGFNSGAFVYLLEAMSERARFKTAPGRTRFTVRFVFDSEDADAGTDAG